MKRRLVWLLDEYVNHKMLRHRWHWLCDLNERLLWTPDPSDLADVAQVRRDIQGLA